MYVPQPVQPVVAGLHVVHVESLAPPEEYLPAAHAAPLGVPEVDPATQ